MRNIPADKKKYTNSVTATSSIFKMEIFLFEHYYAFERLHTMSEVPP